VPFLDTIVISIIYLLAY